MARLEDTRAEPGRSTGSCWQSSYASPRHSGTKDVFRHERQRWRGRPIFSETWVHRSCCLPNCDNPPEIPGVLSAEACAAAFCWAVPPPSRHGGWHLIGNLVSPCCQCYLIGSLVLPCYQMLHVPPPHSAALCFFFPRNFLRRFKVYVHTGARPVHGSPLAAVKKPAAKKSFLFGDDSDEDEDPFVSARQRRASLHICVRACRVWTVGGACVCARRWRWRWWHA